MYIYLWENSRGHPDNDSFMQFSTKIDGFEQKYSQGFENSYNSHEQYPLEIFFFFHHLPKLYFGFKRLQNIHSDPVECSLSLVYYNTVFPYLKKKILELNLKCP